jgi:hypothetical protein
MDKLLKVQIIETVKNSVADIFEVYQEEWLTGDKLCERFQMFNRGWLKSYGHLLPRTQAVVNDGNQKHHSSWAYPAHKIAKMIADGKIKQLNISP